MWCVVVWFNSALICQTFPSKFSSSAQFRILISSESFFPSSSFMKYRQSFTLYMYIPSISIYSTYPIQRFVTPQFDPTPSQVRIVGLVDPRTIDCQRPDPPTTPRLPTRSFFSFYFNANFSSTSFSQAPILISSPFRRIPLLLLLGCITSPPHGKTVPEFIHSLYSSYPSPFVWFIFLLSYKSYVISPQHQVDFFIFLIDKPSQWL